MILTFICDLKFKQNVDSIPLDKRERFRSFIGVNSFKIIYFIMSDSDVCTEEESNVKKILRPKLYMACVFYVIFILSILLSFVIS